LAMKRERVLTLATGFFTGESRRKPLGENFSGKSKYIRALANHDFGLLDSFFKSTKSSLPNPLGEIHLAKSNLPGTSKTAV
jgi:hypothetical protein